MIEIREASSTEDYAFAKQLILDYATFLDINFDFQNLEQELSQLPQMYGAPKGAMLLAFDAEALAGGVGLRDLGDGYGEMKRLFVYPSFQGKGVGTALMRAFVEKGRELGYSALRLDTLPRLDRAYRLYQRFGFRAIAPYCYNPFPDALYLELTLSDPTPDC
jgi:putative acetyltransferase